MIDFVNGYIILRFFNCGLEVDRALLFSQPMLISGLDLQKPYNNLMPVLTNVLVENVSCIDVDVETKHIYWTDVKAGAIRRAFLNGTGLETVIDSGVMAKTNILT